MEDRNKNDKASVRDFQSEQDDFWNIENLLPQKNSTTAKSAPQSRASKPSVDTETVAITLEAPQKATNGQSIKEQTEGGKIHSDQIGAVSVESGFTLEKLKPEAEKTYTYENGLIRKVQILKWGTNYAYYEKFCKMAYFFFTKSAPACEPVPFFSFMPQYDQMKRSQMKWYLYWRSQARSGSFLPTDYSYIFLYSFEIINLADKIDTEKGLKMLCELWCHYEKTYPFLRRYLSDWICDYSLIHQVPLPIEVFGDRLPSIAEAASLREFFYNSCTDCAAQEAQIYLAFCCHYDYKKSKAYTEHPASKEVFDRHIPGALQFVISKQEEQSGRSFRTALTLTDNTFDAYVGALCSPVAKKRIEVTFYSFSRSHELRFLIADIVKYTENKLRVAFGIKSKLTVSALPDSIAALIDTYLQENGLLRNGKKSKPEDPRPEWEKLYDLPANDGNGKSAFDIERDSWDTTKKLVEAFDAAETVESIEKFESSLEKRKDIEKEEPVLTQTIQPLIEFEDNKSTIESSSFNEILLLQAVLDKNTQAQKTIYKANKLLPEQVMEQINQEALEVIGDVILYPIGDVLDIYEDYRDDVMRWIAEKQNNANNEQQGN